MLELRPVSFNQIQQWFVDFQKKSKCFELPPEEARLTGIYNGQELIGYFVLVEEENKGILIHQGYLKPIERHKAFSYQAMKILEKKLKDIGCKKIRLQASRSFEAYHKFMKNLGFKPEAVVFSKEI